MAGILAGSLARFLARNNFDFGNALAHVRARWSWAPVLLGLILALALGLRLHGVDWDQGYGFHPDERDIYMRSGCMYDLLTEAPGHRGCGYVSDEPAAEPGLPGIGALLDSERSPLNPHWFPLGSILIYVLVFFRSVAEVFTDMNAMDMRFIARPLSALVDTGSVFLVYLLGRRLYGTPVGLLAAGLAALAVIHVQHSHFYRPETFTVFFTLASFWAMLRMSFEPGRRRLRDSAILGLMLGLALAPKVNVLPLLAPLAVVYFYRVLDEVEGRWTDITPDVVQRMAGHAVLCGLVAVGVLFVTSPYAFLDFGDFVEDLTFQTRMAGNAGLVPFTIQYVDTPAFFYQVSQSSVWGLGIPLGVVAWLAVPFTVILALTSAATRRGDLLLLAWVVPSFLFLENFEVRFLRYIFPLVPVMIILAARMLVWLWDNHALISGQAARIGIVLKGQVRIAVAAVMVFVVLSTAFYSLAFQRVYAEDHPALAASNWFAENVPAGTLIVHDNHWDEHIPDFYRYEVWQFPVYEADTQAKMEQLALRLSRSEYLVFYSVRPYASVARDPERFPRSNSYYRQLFAGELGYTLERDFTSYPQLAGVAFRDDALERAGLSQPAPEVAGQESDFSLGLGYADDNVVGYDHPRVLVFRNEEQFTEERLRSQLVRSGSSGYPPVGLMLSEEDLAAQRKGGTFSEIFDRNGWTNRFPVLSWLLATELIYLLALPFAIFIFKALPDRGIIFARILGLLAVTYVAWLVVSLGWADFSRATVYVAMAALALLSAAAWAFRWREMVEFLRARWRLVLTGEAIFLAAFLAFVALRYANPDLWHPYRGGEKPMELAYLNAVVRSTTLPPFDPWFAGGYLNYYYWGYSVLAGIIRITGILPTTAFNLAVPLFFALTITGAYSLVYNLVEGVRSHTTPPVSQETATATGPGLRRLPWWWGGVTAGLIAALFVGVIGNLDGIVQIVQGVWVQTVDSMPFPGFDFWRSSRMVPPLENFDPSFAAFWVPEPVPDFPNVSFHITEFPFFTFLFADLHAHMMVIPFTVLVLGLGLNLVAGLRAPGVAWKAFAMAALAVALGALWAINSWDYPAYAVLVVALLGLAAYFCEGRPSRRLLLFGVLAAGVLAVSLLAFWPFHQAYQTFNSGLDVSQWRTPVDRYFGVHGLFIFVTLTFLIIEARETLVSMVRGLTGRRAEPVAFRWLRTVVGMMVLAAAYLALAGYWNVVILIVFLVLAVVAGWRLLASDREDRPFASVPLVLLAMSFLVAAGVDLVTVEGDVGRMNTFFKYYLEVWVLMAVCSAYMLWRMGAAAYLERRWDWKRTAWVGMLVILVGSSLIYTALGTRDRVADRFDPLAASGLDGAAYMASAVHFERDVPIALKWDREAVHWLQDNAAGSPVVLEAHMEQYRWGSRFAIYTGLPTVLGWPWHQIQQRTDYSAEILRRADNVGTMYNTRDIELARALMREYDVTYVVIGELERVLYDDRGLEKFVRMDELGHAELVFRNQGIDIYQLAR